MNKLSPLFADGVFGGGPELGGAEIFIIVPALFWILFCIWMFIDCAICEKSIGWKIGGLLGIVFFPCVVPPLYYFLRKRPRNREDS